MKPKLRSQAGLVLLLLLQASALAWQAWRVGITFDEPHHLADAYLYWLGQDTLFPPDTPPLTRITSGWMPRLLGAPLRKDTEGWKRQGSFDIGNEIVQDPDVRAVRRLFFLTRLTFLIYPLALTWLVWRWARELFGGRVALFLAACVVLEPTILAHGALIKSDVAAAWAAVWFGYLGWHYWLEPRPARLLAMAAGLAAALLAKFTLLVLAPAAVLLVLLRGPRLPGLAAVLGIPYLGLLAGYPFSEIRPIEPREYQEMAAEGFSRREISLARLAGRVPWPDRFVQGLRYIGAADRNEGFPAYMLGRKIEYGAPLYFPLAWAIKFPIALQILTAAGLAASAARVRRRRAGAADAFVWFIPAWLLIFALRSHIHIGFRHILPVLPFCILGGGFALRHWSLLRSARWAAAACLGWLAAASAAIYPQGISYFNEWIGGPKNGWKYLADSNIDWGQNLPELAQYIARRGIGKLTPYYFGADVPWRYIPADKLILRAPPWGPEWEKERVLAPEPGVYAISVNVLLGYFFSPNYRDYFAYFKAREPDARAGWSIFIYHVN